MTSPDLETAEQHLTLDVSARKSAFRDFRRALRAVARDPGPDEATRLALRAVDPDLGYTELMALRRLVRLEEDSASKPLRVAVLGGATTIQFVQLLELFLAAHGVAATFYESEYGVFRQELLMPGSGLDRFGPDVIVVATDSRDVSFPAFTSDVKDAESVLAREAEGWAALWESAATRHGATVIQNTFEVPPWSVFGNFGLRHPGAPQNFLNRLNAWIAEHAPPHVVLHDLQALASRAGEREWFDPRFYHEAKMPCGPESLVEYGHSVASVIVAIRGRSRKVLVLDLDNTLWGGVIGDDGPEGIVYGQGSGEGEGYVAFQRYAKALYDRGVVLAVCSKNDEAVAREAFEKRDMVLGLDHFACFVANWQNKADNLRQIAERLDLGTDSLVFADDNPAERAIVRRYVPEVAVPELPDDPAGYIRAVARHHYFETVSFTREDGERVHYYAANAKRSELLSASVDLGEFLQSLEMKATVEPVCATNLARVAQLVNKSNQFNLTTKRRTAVEIEKLAADPDWTTLTVSLSDRLGDNGLISVIFLQRQEEALVVDTWLMSCRVLLRGVEEFVLNEIVEVAADRGLVRVEGIYAPTPRNGMVADHYEKLGFECAGEEGDGSRWTLAVASHEPREHFILCERSSIHA